MAPHNLQAPVSAVEAGAPPPKSSPSKFADETPLRELPYTPSLDVTAMDRTVDPCADLYTFACGGWQKSNPIPADQAMWSVYRKLTNEVTRHLWSLLLEASERAGNPTASRRSTRTTPEFT
ncbi:Metallopeptidase [Labilithrix luteola]|uniref:Metallopeptidase n=1 Tax=Labilithrix luteola TaxID=1391654 RepID=A0A0K1PKR9_9BACT|nr:Metallopeptidase [Labilithrix luteola]